MSDFEIKCAYCPPNSPPLMRVSPPEDSDLVEWRKAWKRTATGTSEGKPQFNKVQCPNCGGQFSLVCDGTPAEDGGCMAAVNVTEPRIESLSVGGGNPLGGTVTKLTGHGFDVDGLVVKFAGKPALWQGEATATEVTVKAPRGTYTLNVDEGPMHKLAISNVSKTFAVDETVTFSVGGSGVLRKVVGAGLMVCVTNMPEDPDSLVDATVYGSSTSASARIAGVTRVEFIPGEGVSGAASGSRGVVKTSSPLVIDSPTAAFGPRELVVGDTSGALVKLKSTPYSGAVDVTVENINGTREGGESCLRNGFTYS